MSLARLRVPVSLLLLLVAGGFAAGGIFPNMTYLGRHDVFSRNGLYVLDVNPEAQSNTVYLASDRSRPLWSCPGALKTIVRKTLLADNGAVVAMIGGGDVTQDDLSGAEGIRLVDRNGATRSHRIVEFNTRPAFSYGCGGNQAIWYDDVVDHGDRFAIVMKDGTVHTFDYSTAPPQRRWLKMALPVVMAGLGVVVLLVRVASRRSAQIEAVEPVGPTS